MIYDVIVIGGGASGMMAAITAAGRGKKAAILEHMDRLGKKILMTGNGKCNYSNTFQDVLCYRTSDTEFTKNVLKRFSQKDATEFFRRNGILTKNRNGYLYPNSGQASVINDVLRLKCENCGVNIIYNAECTEITKAGDNFRLKYVDKQSSQSNYITCHSLIISTGSKAYLKTGSDGSGYKLLSSLGHTIIKPLPALTPLYCSEKYFKSLKGVRCDGTVSLYIDNKFTAQDKGEIQLTDYGISGIPVFQVSRYASIALDKGKRVTAILDFVPDMEKDEIAVMLNYHNSLNIGERLNGLVNKKLSAAILKNAGISPDAESFSTERIVKLLKSTKVNIISTGNFEQAQVCTGGAALDEIDSTTMESKIVKKLFITGEVMDTDGICGGYNLQWAWSTGYIAGESC